MVLVVTRAVAVMFGGYWWCLATVLMGLRSGWWVLVGVENEVGGW